MRAGSETEREWEGLVWAKQTAHWQRSAFRTTWAERAPCPVAITPERHSPKGALAGPYFGARPTRACVDRIDPPSCGSPHHPRRHRPPTLQSAQRSVVCQVRVDARARALEGQSQEGLAPPLRASRIGLRFGRTVVRAVGRSWPADRARDGRSDLLRAM